MQKIKITINNRSKKLSITQLSLSLGLMVISSFLMSSCASEPMPEMIHQLPQPVSIPIPPEITDIEVPDDTYNSEMNDTGTKPDSVATAIPTAKPVPGRPGYVFNPFTQNMVDVKDVPSGSKVIDPQDDDKSHKFYVP